MNLFQLEKDIQVVCVQAESFPEGVMAAHQKLHSIISHDVDRRYFSVSFGSADGTIIYKAGAETHDPNEAETLNLEPFIIKKGNYNSILIQDYMNNIPAIGAAFQELLKYPRIDPQGACIEWYISNKEVQCMVRLAD